MYYMIYLPETNIEGKYSTEAKYVPWNSMFVKRKSKISVLSMNFQKHSFAIHLSSETNL